MSDPVLRPLIPKDRPWVKRFVIEHWGSDTMVMHGTVVQISQQAGFVAEIGGEPVGLVTYRIDAEECEITSLDSLREGIGIGTAFIHVVADTARKAGCRRLFLITTNDNLHALHFYQRRGFTLSALYVNAVAEARKIKPEIPLLGYDDIPIRDEIELEMILMKQKS